MHRIDTVGNEGGRFTNGNPDEGRPPTLLDSSWFNAVQEEIAAVIEGAGLELSKGEIQLPKALDRIIAGSLAAALKELVAQLDLRFQKESEARERVQGMLREALMGESQARGNALMGMETALRGELSATQTALTNALAKETTERKGDTDTTHKRLSEEVSKLSSLLPLMKAEATTGSLAEMVLQTSEVGWSLQFQTRVGNEIRTVGTIKGRNPT